MGIGDKIKERRLQLKWSQEDLAQRMGYKSRSTIAKIESGENDITQSKIKEIAKVLQTTVSFLMNWDEDHILPSGAFRPHTKSVRMMGYAAAGKPLEDLNQDQRYVDIEGDYDVDFCITVKGDSMIGADINDGDIVFIKSMPEVENGQIACVEIDNERVCLKRFYKNGNQIILNSENPKYMPMTFNEENCESIRVLGLAVIKQSEIR